jgi:hypothetical protein
VDEDEEEQLLIIQKILIINTDLQKKIQIYLLEIMIIIHEIKIQK